MKITGIHAFEARVSIILEKHQAIYCSYAEMSDIIDGPFNAPPYGTNQEKNAFRDEYTKARRLFIEMLEVEKINTGGMDIMDFAQGSRCLGIYLGSNIEQLDRLLSVTRQTLELLSNMRLCYCASIDVDYDYRSNDGYNCRYWHIGLTESRLLCHVYCARPDRK